MATIIRNRVNRVRSAPNTSASIRALGGDPLTQVYDESLGVYIPDRTLLPLTLVAEIYSDGQDVSSKVTNQSWWMVDSSGNEVQITSSTAGYELVNTVVPMQLKVKRNVMQGSAAEYVYRYTADGIASAVSVSLNTEINPAPAPELDLDCASALAWNPFDAEANDWLTIRPTVRAYNRTGLTVRWRRKDGTVTRAIDYDDPRNIELRLDGQNMKVNRRWMGDRCSLVCELMSGTQVLVTVPVTIVRRIPEYTARNRVGSIFSDTDSVVHAKCEVRMSGSVLTDPSRELLIKWYEGTVEVGRGNSHDFPCSGKESIDPGMSVEDRGCLKLLTTADGRYITTSDGKYILAR